MANATVSRLGLVNNTGTAFDALFLKIFRRGANCVCQKQHF